MSSAKSLNPASLSSSLGKKPRLVLRLSSLAKLASQLKMISGEDDCRGSVVPVQSTWGKIFMLSFFLILLIFL